MYFTGLDLWNFMAVSAPFHYIVPIKN